jgi:hypothetical protein
MTGFLAGAVTFASMTKITDKDSSGFWWDPDSNSLYEFHWQALILAEFTAVDILKVFMLMIKWEIGKPTSRYTQKPILKASTIYFYLQNKIIL